MVLLSVWSCEHFAIGRPVPDTSTVWDEEGDRDRLPTWILRWYNVNREWGPAPSMYLDYTNQFDLLHHSMEVPHNSAAYDAYLAWLGDRTRLKLLSPAFDPEDVYAMADTGDTDMDEMRYFKSLWEHCQRQELAPVANWVKTRILAKGFTAALGCRKVDDVSPMRSGSSSHHSSRGRGRHGEGSSRDVHMETSSRAQEKEENDDEQDEEDEGHQQEPQVEMNTSQMSGPATQTLFDRSPFEFRERDRPRKAAKFTPDAFAKGKNPAPSTHNMEQVEEEDEDGSL
ncbi:unnamed protein product [Alopecurus aequalis]